MKDYTSLPAFEAVVLEESYVLGIHATSGRVLLEADVVLTTQHQKYEPHPGTSDSFARGTIEFTGVTSLTWSDQGLPPAVDASGEVDYGHIDFFRTAPGLYQLGGDFGQMRIEAADVKLELVNAS